MNDIRWICDGDRANPLTFPKRGKGDRGRVPKNVLARFWGSGVAVDEDVKNATFLIVQFSNLEYISSLPETPRAL